VTPPKASVRNGLSEPLLHHFCHDIRVPLTSIGVSAELLATGRLSPEQTAEFAQIIARQALRIGRMIDNLECTSTSIREEDSTGDFDISILASETVRRMEADADSRGVSLQIVRCDGAPRVPGPSEFYESALFWILEVGLRASHSGSRVEISFETLGGRTASRIRMNAAGLDEGACEGLAGFSVEHPLPDLVRGIAGPLRMALDNFMAVGGAAESRLQEGALEWTLILPGAASRSAA
jgi:signal transduction histidine kinase